jgi:hypothetical protein
MKLTEYNKKITSDEELEKWKSTWDRKSKPPAEVLNYIRNVVIPRNLEQCDRLLILNN